MRIFKANGHYEKQENIQEWFCSETYIDFWSLMLALAETYSSFLQVSSAPSWWILVHVRWVYLPANPLLAYKVTWIRSAVIRFHFLYTRIVNAEPVSDFSLVTRISWVLICSRILAFRSPWQSGVVENSGSWCPGVASFPGPTPQLFSHRVKKTGCENLGIVEPGNEELWRLNPVALNEFRIQVPSVQEMLNPKSETRWAFRFPGVQANIW